MTRQEFEKLKVGDKVFVNGSWRDDIDRTIQVVDNVVLWLDKCFLKLPDGELWDIHYGKLELYNKMPLPLPG